MANNFNSSFTIAVGLSASSKKWKNTVISWQSFIAKLANPTITQETYDAYMKAPKAEQTRIKDVGGFVGGEIIGSSRDKNAIKSRQLVTLDIDFSNNDFWSDFILTYNCAAVLHATHKHSPENPRHRLIIPLNRPVTVEEYQAISRRIAGNLNIELFDQSTFEVNRLMFWPSVSCDVDYYYECQEGPALDADEILASYTDWRNTTEWPRAARETSAISLAIKRQEDPEQKKGIVGVFCRAYSIQEAIEAFIPDEYTRIDDTRYTYTKGSTAGGLVIYDDKFAYSHHGTDPAGGRLCNAFDLVRLHLFGDLDTGKEKSETEKPSFKRMEQFATKDPRTIKQIALEKFEEAKFDFAVTPNNDEPYDDSWLSDLEANSKGEYESSANNINLILQHDRMLVNAFALNVFDNKRYINKSLPWRKVPGRELFRDVDLSGVRNYIECIYGISASQKIDDALALEFERNQFHPIINYLKSLEWDGQSRIDTLLIDYFGAEDNAYTRAAIRKMLTAAVARVFEPGIKFDLVLILVGEQGTYKSTFVKKLGKEWFSDTFMTVQGKESFEQLQGAWIIEIAELSGLKKAEVETIKHYVAKREDSFRPAYGRVVETYKRQCVFFGTTNSVDFLRDPTGNRRFIPIDVNKRKITKSVIDDLTTEEIDQIWAEALELYRAGETLYLSEAENEQAVIAQQEHAEIDERRGLIEQYLNKLYPNDWDDMDLCSRRNWLESPIGKKGTIQKDFVCVAELWCECLGKDKNDMSRYNTRELNDIMRTIPEWEVFSSTKNFSVYGKQRFYKRKDSLL